MQDRQAHAFTLIELLVVIAIIAILLGLAFPAFQGVQNQAKKAQAKNDLTQIVTAVNAYYTEYGRYPTTETQDTAATYGPPPNPSNNVLFNELRAKSSALNTRQIVFISPSEDTNQTNPKGKIGSNGQFSDPWGIAYLIRIDADYDNDVPNPYDANSGAGGTTVRQGVITWSLGKNQTGGTGDKKSSASADDVISWQ